MTGRRALLPAATCAAVVAACGSSSGSTIPQVGTASPLTASKVDLRPSGSVDFAVDDPQSVTFQLDNAGLLHMTVGITSRAAATSTVTMTATLLDANGLSVGSATGGALGVAPGSHVTVELTGSRPTGVVSAVNLIIAGQPAPTPRG